MLPQGAGVLLPEFSGIGAASTAAATTGAASSGFSLIGMANPALLAVSVLALAAGQKQKRKARKNEAAARAEEARLRAIEARRQRVNLARERQVARSQVINAAANTGTTGSSGAIGALSSIESQYGAGVGFQYGYDLFSNRAAGFINKANQAGYRAEQAAGVFNLATLGLQLANPKKGT